VPHPAVLRKPPPSAEDDIYYVGFCILGGRRLYSQVGPQPIPLTEIMAYMDEACMTDLDDRETFLEIVCDLDACEMNLLAKKASKK
jgi:hypothetical protein